jgi:hypothetical protein
VTRHNLQILERFVGLNWRRCHSHVLCSPLPSGEVFLWNRVRKRNVSRCVGEILCLVNGDKICNTKSKFIWKCYSFNIKMLYLNPLGGGLTPPLGPFFRSPRFRFLRSFCSSPLGPYKSQHCGHIGLLYILRMIHEGDCGVIGGANDDCRGSRSTRRKPAPAPLCPTTRSGFDPRTAAVGSRRLTAWAMARPLKPLLAT